MNKKELLQELCENLEIELNQRKEKDFTRKVNLFSGQKPFYNKIAWFVEISIDDTIVFRESYIPREGEDLLIVEGFLISRVFRHIFSFGVMSSFNVIYELNNKKSDQ